MPVAVALGYRVRKPLVVALCAAVLAASGCQKENGTPVLDINVEWEISPQPPQRGPATVTLRLTDASRRPVAGARITVEGNMSHAGMAPVFGAARETASGQYQAPIEFTMAGDWVMLLDVTLPNGQKLERQVTVKGVRAN